MEHLNVLLVLFQFDLYCEVNSKHTGFHKECDKEQNESSNTQHLIPLQSFARDAAKLRAVEMSSIRDVKKLK
mgnify:CR=1 FL=1